MKVYRTALADPERSAKYYQYDQNNSGGSFAYNEERGISTRVFIEAYDAVDANHRAEMIGIYFDGCATGRDCSCCGDRWYENYGGLYGAVSEDLLGQHIYDLMTGGWRDGGWQGAGKPEIFVHKIDGTIVGFDFGDETDLDFLNNEGGKELEA